MAFLSKLAFWKKKGDIDDIGKDLGLDKELGLDMGTGPSPDLGMGIEPQQQQQSFQKYPSYQQPGFQAPSAPSFPGFQQPSNDSYIASKNLEVISSKLDALRVSIESINQRLANIEAIARGEQEDTRRRRYY